MNIDQGDNSLGTLNDGLEAEAFSTGVAADAAAPGAWAFDDACGGAG
jgi:hypothetical protein